MTETVEVCDYCAAATCHVGEIAELRAELNRARETLREIRPLIAYANECAPTMSCGAALRMIDEAARPMTETERIDGRIRDLAELCTRRGTPCADGLLAEIGRLRTEIEQQRGGKIGYFATAAQAIEERDAARLVVQEMTRHWHEARGERDAALAENARLERRAEADEKGLNRWCNYQDRLFAVMTSDEIRAFEERLTADGWWNEPLCRHEGELARTEGDLGVAIREAAAAREALRQIRDRLAWVPNSNGATEATALVDAALDQRLTQ